MSLKVDGREHGVGKERKILRALRAYFPSSSRKDIKLLYGGIVKAVSVCRIKVQPWILLRRRGHWWQGGENNDFLA